MLWRHPSLAECRESIDRSFEVLAGCFESGGKLLICGNGGSAADAEHIAGELLKGFASKRPLGPDQRVRLGDETADRLQEALPAIPLTGFLSLRTAFGNDCDPAWDFAQLTYALGRPGDVLMGISTSGNSENVLHAVEVARGLDIAVIGLTGSPGGTLEKMANPCICVPEREVFKVQELHLPVYHALCLMLEERFFGTGSES